MIDRSNQRWILAALAVVALAALAATPSLAAKKKSKKASLVTRQTPASIGPGLATTLNTPCPKKNHATGGGYLVSPSFSPGGLTGTRTAPTESRPTGFRAWAAGAAAFATPPSPGTFTSFARCEPDTAIKSIGTGTPNFSTIPAGLSQTVTMNCTAGGKVVTAGFQTSAPPLLSDPSKRAGSVLQSRRSGPSSWTLQVGNPSPPVGAGDITLSTSFICAKGGKSISEASTTVPIGDDTRTTADVSCSKKQQVVSGGFSIAPNVAGAPVPAVSVDEFHPSGSRGWHLGLYELTGFDLPAGAAVTLYAYCKKPK